MKELQNCPFCGGKAELHRGVGGGDDCYFYECAKCGVSTGAVTDKLVRNQAWFSEKFPNGLEKKKTKRLRISCAKNLWNTRATTKREAELIDALEEVVHGWEEELQHPSFSNFYEQYMIAKQALSNHKQQEADK